MSIPEKYRAVLALGSNLGDSEDIIEEAVAQLQTLDMRLIALSGLYATAPVGGPEQPDYINAVIEVATDLDPYELLAACHRVEQAHRRTREVRWGPRTLDIDIIAIEQRMPEPAEGAEEIETQWEPLLSTDPVLTLPHPRARERAFVLVPWAEANPQALLPISPDRKVAVVHQAYVVSRADEAAGQNAVTDLRGMCDACIDPAYAEPLPSLDSAEE
ncbi:MAG: 2-amino-4-hydroxy-6-hydroxymethyldihydropteridine diphosphokinase [Rothia sp. (in: high G+C Gram-positive bacteria)]|nr:2-amino-4-hydroxy-6-hydroxymethyldihydropteridine diphosphokinase [Rothia sp. (in: high G+C Gram-positive bacteria)]MDO5749730.1 2-amino-4-hydroxy-6-hydroxymethyldihydropteridine diphosphokinase [Rothia sp. (in: high G+C Gram-positive bacteria)]